MCFGRFSTANLSRKLPDGTSDHQPQGRYRKQRSRTPSKVTQWTDWTNRRQTAAVLDRDSVMKVDECHARSAVRGHRPVDLRRDRARWTHHSLGSASAAVVTAVASLRRHAGSRDAAPYSVKSHAMDESGQASIVLDRDSVVSVDERHARSAVLGLRASGSATRSTRWAHHPLGSGAATITSLRPRGGSRDAIHRAPAEPRAVRWWAADREARDTDRESSGWLATVGRGCDTRRSVAARETDAAR